MKNFIDLLSFNCHSPSLYGKNALTIATVGGMGEKTTAKYLTLIATCWGAHVVGTLNVRMDYLNSVGRYCEKTERNMTELAQTYMKALDSDEKPIPNYQGLLVFASLSVYVLVAIVKKTLNLNQSLYTILQSLSATLFEKEPIYQALSNAGYTNQECQLSNQANLFD